MRRFTGSEPEIVELDNFIAAEGGHYHFWSRSEIIQALRVAGTEILYLKNGQPSKWQGFVIYRYTDVGAELFYIFVSSESQRSGIGRYLLTQLMQKLAEKGNIEKLFLEVRPSNHGACALYKALSFHQVGIRKNYYKDGEDALIMERSLGDKSGL